MPFRLVDRETGRILKKYDGDFIKFLNTSWGGMFPFKFAGDDRLYTGWGDIAGCERYDAYWEEVKDDYLS